eukprot:419684-Pleurochrysis_carterae.AAC.2
MAISFQQLLKSRNVAWLRVPPRWAGPPWRSLTRASCCPCRPPCCARRAEGKHADSGSKRHRRTLLQTLSQRRDRRAADDVAMRVQ